ncbi:unnamed protein product [Effrenium voratum]|uniref:Uncharacterized protein n=1 Tax=Effrenium voratum TaxID=2562239 RepID=A0AA36IVH2_9DINO|nr:unnamed protein product [Effrenium voratum]
MTLDSLPRTPRARTGPVTPPRSPRKTALPQMMEALYMDSLATVEAVLREEPDSAWEPFWDYDQETPLCFAARQLCDVKILDLLLQRGAKVDVGNRDGRRLRWIWPRRQRRSPRNGRPGTICLSTSPRPTSRRYRQEARRTARSVRRRLYSSLKQPQLQ